MLSAVAPERRPGQRQPRPLEQRFVRGLARDREESSNPGSIPQIRKRAGMSRRVPAAADDDTVVVEKLFHKELARHRILRERPDIEIDGAVLQAGLHDREQAFDDAQPDIGIMFAKGSEHVGQQRDMRRAGEAGRHIAGPQALQLLVRPGYASSSWIAAARRTNAFHGSEGHPSRAARTAPR